MPPKRAVLLCLFFTAFTLPAWAQLITGTMRGVVTDANGRPLAGVTVLVNSRSQPGQTRYLTTNDLGVFNCAALPVGVYSVEARLEGFQYVQANRVEVDLGRTANVPVIMNLAKSETVQVVGDTPMIDSQNAGVPTFFKQEMVENLPTKRHMWILMQVAPGLTTDNTDSLDPGIIAFGSNRQSNTWNIDGLDITSPDTGNPRFEANPDMIEQIQVFGLGAPAEYGNHTGAILNVITKKGSNDLHGGVNSFSQSQALTGTNVRLPNSDFVFHREKYYDVTGQLGGPILKDKIWVFGAVQSTRDAYSNPGNNPDYTPLTKLDRYDLKMTAQVAKKYDINGFFHNEEYDFPEATKPLYTTSALAHDFGGTSAWGASLTSALNEPVASATGAAACDATPRPDYLTTTGTLTFKTGISTKTIQIPVCGDTAFEANEIFDVNLNGATNAAIGDSQGLGVIMNNDSQINLPISLPSVSIAPLEVSEGGTFGSGTSFKLNVILSVQNPSGASVVCAPAETNLPKTSPVQSASGGTSCTAGADFILSGNHAITFGPTETSKSCPVTICGDTVNETDESFVVNLSNAQGAIIGTGSATVVIKD